MHGNVSITLMLSVYLQCIADPDLEPYPHRSVYDFYGIKTVYTFPDPDQDHR